MRSEIVAAAALGFASLPHCAGMCGPLIGGGCAAAGGSVAWTAARYLAGRLVGYSVVGAAAGAIGRGLIPGGVAPAVRVVTQLMVAVAIVVLGLRWLRMHGADAKGVGGSPLVQLRTSAKQATPRWRQAVTRVLRTVAQYLPTDPLGLGIVTALFPCGALAGGLVLAASTGDAWGGMLVMAVFAVASAPALAAVAGVGRGVARWAGSRSDRMRRAGGALLVLTGAVCAAGVLVRMAGSLGESRPGASGAMHRLGASLGQHSCSCDGGVTR